MMIQEKTNFAALQISFRNNLLFFDLIAFRYKFIYFNGESD